jgi:ankyrin repeat protein
MAPPSALSTATHGAPVGVCTDALCRAAQRGDFRQLLDVTSAWHRTDDYVPGTADALMLAVANGHAECVGLLLQGMRAHPQRAPVLWHGLGLAAARGHIDIVRAIIAARGDMHVGGAKHAPPWELAAAHGHDDIVQLLLDGKAVPYTDSRAFSVACVAARHGHCGILSRLAPRVCLGTARTFTTVAHVAAQADQVASLTVLCAAKVNVDDVNWHHDTPLHFAVLAEAHSAAEYLVLQAKANIDARHYVVPTPLCLAARQKSCRMLRLLLRAKADVDRRSHDFQWGIHNSTPLCEAASKGYVAHVRLLLRAKADPTIANSDASTPAVCAERRGHAAVAALLRTHVH